MTDKLVFAISRRVWSVSGIINTARRPVGKLISHVPGEPFVLFPATKAKDVAIRVGYDGVEGFFRHGVLAVDVSGANPEAVVEVARHTPFIKDAGFPIERERHVTAGLLEGHSVQRVPVCPIDVKLEIPFGRRAIR